MKNLRCPVCSNQWNAIFPPLIHQPWPEPFSGALCPLSHSPLITNTIGGAEEARKYLRFRPKKDRFRMTFCQQKKGFSQRDEGRRRVAAATKRGAAGRAGYKSPFWDGKLILMCLLPSHSSFLRRPARMREREGPSERASSIRE